MAIIDGNVRGSSYQQEPRSLLKERLVIISDVQGEEGLHFNGVEVTDYKIKEVKKEEVPVVEVASVPICAWYKCDNPVALNKLRHCSEVCRKRQNRYDYKQRQKLKRQT